MKLAELIKIHDTATWMFDKWHDSPTGQLDTSAVTVVNSKWGCDLTRQLERVAADGVEIDDFVAAKWSHLMVTYVRCARNFPHLRQYDGATIEYSDRIWAAEAFARSAVNRVQYGALDDLTYAGILSSNDNWRDELAAS